MHVQLMPGATRVDRPSWIWIGVALEIFTALGAIPVGLMFLADPIGKLVQVRQGLIEATVFGSYVVPGLYLLLVNGAGMLALAALTIRRHWLAPWLTGTLGVGLIIWILVEILILPETTFLTWLFLATGFALGFMALFLAPAHRPAPLLNGGGVRSASQPERLENDLRPRSAAGGRIDPPPGQRPEPVAP